MAKWRWDQQTDLKFGDESYKVVVITKGRKGDINALLQVNTTKTIIFGLPARFSKHFVRHRKMSVKVRGKK